MKKDTVSKLKFKRLQRQLKLPLWQAIGLLEALWHCTLTNAPDGDIGRMSDDDIAAAIEWEGDAMNLIHALVECNWLDRDDAFRLLVHDWSQHVPTYMKGAYERNGKLFADQRAKQGAKHTAKHDAKQVAKDGCLAGAPILSQSSQANPSQVNNAADAADSDELFDWLVWWNSLKAEGLVGSSVNEEEPSEAIVKAWKRVTTNARLRKLLSDRDALRREIQASSFCRDGWFRLEKLFGGKNRDHELIVRKLLDGGYSDTGKSKLETHQRQAAPDI